MLLRRLVDGRASRDGDGQHVVAQLDLPVMAIAASRLSITSMMVIDVAHRARRDGYRHGGTAPLARRWPSQHIYWGLLRDGHPAGEHALDRIPVDGLTLAARGVAHGAVREAIDVAQRAGGVLMHQRDRVSREDALVSACEFEPMGYVLSDVVSAGIVDRKAMVYAREERAISPALELTFKFWKSDQHQR